MCTSVNEAGRLFDGSQVVLVHVCEDAVKDAPMGGTDGVALWRGLVFVFAD